MAHEELIQQLTTKVTEIEQERATLGQVIQEIKALIAEIQSKDSQETADFQRRADALLQKVTTAEQQST